LNHLTLIDIHDNNPDTHRRNKVYTM